MKLLILYFALILYGLYELMSHIKAQSFEETLLVLSNIVVILCLIFARYNIWKVEKGSLKEVSMDEEDVHQVSLERKAYSAAGFIQIALSVSFTTLLIGFLLVRIVSQPLFL